MTTLLVEELRTELIHEFLITKQFRNVLGAIYPYIAMVGAPAGNFKIKFYRDNNLVFTRTFTSQDLKDSLESFKDNLHVWYPIIPEFPIQLNKGLYKVRLSATGYTYSGDSFIGWIRQHENLNNKLNYEPLNDAKNPLALRIKVLGGY